MTCRADMFVKQYPWISLRVWSDHQLHCPRFSKKCQSTYQRIIRLSDQTSRMDRLISSYAVHICPLCTFSYLWWSLTPIHWSCRVMLPDNSYKNPRAKHVSWGWCFNPLQHVYAFIRLYTNITNHIKHSKWHMLFMHCKDTDKIKPYQTASYSHAFLNRPFYAIYW